MVKCSHLGNPAGKNAGILVPFLQLFATREVISEENLLQMPTPWDQVLPSRNSVTLGQGARLL